MSEAGSYSPSRDFKSNAGGRAARRPAPVSSSGISFRRPHPQTCGSMCEKPPWRRQIRRGSCFLQNRPEYGVSNHFRVKPGNRSASAGLFPFRTGVIPLDRTRYWAEYPGLHRNDLQKSAPFFTYMENNVREHGYWRAFCYYISRAYLKPSRYAENAPFAGGGGVPRSGGRFPCLLLMYVKQVVLQILCCKRPLPFFLSRSH